MKKVANQDATKFFNLYKEYPLLSRLHIDCHRPGDNSFAFFHYAFFLNNSQDSMIVGQSGWLSRSENYCIIEKGATFQILPVVKHLNGPIIYYDIYQGAWFYALLDHNNNLVIKSVPEYINNFLNTNYEIFGYNKSYNEQLGLNFFKIKGGDIFIYDEKTDDLKLIETKTTKSSENVLAIFKELSGYSKAHLSKHVLDTINNKLYLSEKEYIVLNDNSWDDRKMTEKLEKSIAYIDFHKEALLKATYKQIINKKNTYEDN